MLKDYLEQIAGELRQGRPVYLAPASMETVVIAKLLRGLYDVMPTALCDNDPKKQGKYLNSLPELQILSFDKALEDSDSKFLIVSPHHGAAIMGDLMGRCSAPERRILNYQPVEHKTTCRFFAHNWIVRDEAFYCCCMENAPLFPHDQSDPAESVEYLDRLRKGMIDGTVPLPEQCRACFHNKEQYIFASRKLTSFDFSFQGWCNYKCPYCSANRPELKDYNDRFSLEQYLVELEKRELVSDIFSVLFAVGEPTLNEKRFPLYDHCGERMYFMDVFSNCSVFDQSLFELACESPVIIRKSFDAGTEESYEKVKGVNCYKKVLDNARRYLEAPYLALNPKYLFVPGVNDNEADIAEFVRMCTELKVDFATPVFSIFGNEFTDSAHAQQMFRLLVDQLAENHIFTANVDTLYSEGYHKLYEESFGRKG